VELALKQYCLNTLHEKRKGLCKTLWVEIYSCLKTFGEFEHVVTCLDVWLIHMFVHRLIKVVEIGILTPRLWLMV